MSADDTREMAERQAFINKVNSLPWFHEIDLGDGILSPGRGKIAALRAQAKAMFENIALTGKTVLDIGCIDGFYSFEAHKRGAKRVLATDHFVWAIDPPRRQAFEIARARVAPAVEDMDIDVFDLTPETVGTFDVVLFSGVLYHMRHPFLAIEHIAPLATEVLILETHLDALDVDRPAMVFYPTTQLNNDPSNWWGPNPACVEAMLRDVGFKSISYQPHPFHGPNRGIFQARR
jgi:tRNA (mo5U34)-methyltransferase